MHHGPVHNAADLSLQVHLLGVVDVRACLELQQRLAFEAAEADPLQIRVLLCEHPDVITMGRSGSRRHLRLAPRDLLSRRLEVHWLARGGGCLLHTPGQLCIYPIVPLDLLGWSVGHYLRRLERVLLATLGELGIAAAVRPGGAGVWGRTGPLAALGIGVRHGVAMHGAFLNVCPPMEVFGYIDTMRGLGALPEERATMSCLLAERGRAVRMQKVRSLLVPSLAEGFGARRQHVHHGHLALPSIVERYREASLRAS